MNLLYYLYWKGRQHILLLTSYYPKKTKYINQNIKSTNYIIGRA